MFIQASFLPAVEATLGTTQHMQHGSQSTG
jgi:hypothetical protein